MATKKKKSPPEVMKPKDVRARRYLLEEWDYTCIVCGERFENLACVTKEHVVPKSMGGGKRDALEPSFKNLAPSHHVCNKLRQTDSILVASKRVEFIRSTMSPEAFVRWLNTPVPNRVVPPEATRPIHGPASLELPEHLPGMR